MTCRHVKDNNIHALPFNNADHVDLYTLCLRAKNRVSSATPAEWGEIQQGIVRRWRENKLAEARKVLENFILE